MKDLNTLLAILVNAQRRPTKSFVTNWLKPLGGAPDVAAIDVGLAAEVLFGRTGHTEDAASVGMSFDVTVSVPARPKFADAVSTSLSFAVASYSVATGRSADSVTASLNFSAARYTGIYFKNLQETVSVGVSFSVTTL